MSSSGASQPTPPSKAQSVDPILRNALRYTISAKEYQLLHQYLLSRAPVVKKRTIHPKRYDAIVKGPDDYNVAAFRAALRLGVVTFSGLKAWEVISMRLLSRGTAKRSQPRTSVLKSPNVRLSSSLALILLFHRLLRRFFLRIRESLLSHEGKSFRRRNPRISRSLTSRLAPAIGSSLAGFFLAVYPGDQLRVTIAIYIMTRALEFGYNYLEELGYFKNKPTWLGSWMIMPVACGQLLHAFVFDRDCFPSGMGDHILKNSPEYIQKRPKDYPSTAQWPGTFDIVDNLADISRQRWPAFVSPILFPNAETLPKRLSSISPITSPAHPAIKSLSCALLHPQDPSCLRTYVQYWIQAFPKIARFFTLFFAAMSITKYKAFLSSPVASLNNLAKRVLRMSLFLSGAIGTSWGSICLFQNILPRTFLSTQRWFLGGFLGGLWAFLERKGGRSNFLYTARMSIDSLWKVGVKRRWWKGVKNGDVLLFVVSLATVNALYEVSPRAVNSGVARKGLGVLRGEGWVDRAVVPTEGKGKEGADPTKTSQRKVFSGSRHLRTLSLLSPDRLQSPSFPQPLDLQDDHSADSRPQLPTRASTSSDITRQVVNAGEHDRYDMGGMPTIQREQLIRAGTQMAADFKKGLFTFMEDIRQATVGDEAVNTAEGNPGMTSVKSLSKSGRKSSDGRPALSRSASSKKNTQQLGSIGDDFWKEMGLSEPKTTAVNKKTHALKNTTTPQKQIRKVASEEDWDNWDTPNESLLVDLGDSKDSSDESDAQTSPVSGPGSSRTSTSTRYHSRRHDSKASSLTSITQEDMTPRDQKRSSIPWPDMTKVSPSNLKRTASHLMREWEKQLTPPPESRTEDYSHGDFMN